MRRKKRLILAMAFALLFVVTFCNMVTAEEKNMMVESQTAAAQTADITISNISKEKLAVMIAAGELPNYIKMVTEEEVIIKKDQAIGIAEVLVDEIEKYEINGAYLNMGLGLSNPNWTVSFYPLDASVDHVQVNVDAMTGEILNFYCNEYEKLGSRNYIARITREEAKEIVRNFITGRLKERMEDYQLQEQPGHDNDYYEYRMSGVKEPIIYSFIYIKKMNNIPVADCNMVIQVDGTTGKVRKVSKNFINFDPALLPSTDTILSSEQALEKCREAMGISLQYTLLYEEDPSGAVIPRIVPVYVPDTNIDRIDAFSGSAINQEGTKIPVNAPKVALLPMVPDARLTTKTVNEDEAQALIYKYKTMAEEILDVDLSDSPSIRRDVSSDKSMSHTYSYGWKVNNDKVNAYFSIDISGNNGNILNLSIGKYKPYADEAALINEAAGLTSVHNTFSWSEGKKKAMDIIQKLFPEQYGFYADIHPTEPQLSEKEKLQAQDYSYSFLRIVNGIRCSNDIIRVNVDRKSGEVTNLNFSWTDGEFPSIDQTISAEEAEAKYMEGLKAMLQYHLLLTYNPTADVESILVTPTLVYTFNTKDYLYNAVYLDAVTGKFIDLSGKEVTIHSATTQPQLPEHWAKRSVELLMAQGVLDGSITDCDVYITKTQAVKMLSIVKGIDYDVPNAAKPSFSDVGSDNPDFIFIENAVQQGLISKSGGKFNGDVRITKEQFAEMLAHLIGYGDVVKDDSIFDGTGLKGVSEHRIGDVLVCRTLGILPVKEGKVFVAKQSVTLGEAAVALYKALEYVK